MSIAAIGIAMRYSYMIHGAIIETAPLHYIILG